MLQDTDIGKPENLSFRANNHEKRRGHKYDEFISGTFAHDAEVVSGAYPDYDYECLFFSLYSDGANPDFRRNTSLAPIVIQCMNFNGDILRMNKGKRVLSYFPKLKVFTLHFKCSKTRLKCILNAFIQMTRAYANTQLGRRLNVMFQQWVIQQLLLNAEDFRHGIKLELFGTIKWLIPVFSLGITDWPEGQGWTGVKQGASVSLRNCRCCRHLTKRFGNTKHGPVGGTRRAVDLFNVYKYVLHLKLILNVHLKLILNLISAYAELKSQKKVKEMKEMADDIEKNESFWVVNRAFQGVTLYTADDLGFLGLFPMDFLHTINKGIIPLLTDICDAYIEQSSSRGIKKQNKGKKVKTKTARRLGEYYSFLPNL